MKSSKARREQRKRAEQRKIMEGQANTKNPTATSITMQEAFNYKVFLRAPKEMPATPMQMNPFGCQDPFCVFCYPYMKGVAPNKKKEEDMYNTAAVSSVMVSNEKTQEAKAFDRLLVRMNDAHTEKRTELKREFGLIGDERPTTPKEMIERIKDGQFVLPEAYEDVYCYNFSDYVEWRNPKIKQDKPGYLAAEKVLDKKFTEAVDKIYISNGEEGLKVLNKFEDSKVH